MDNIEKVDGKIASFELKMDFFWYELVFVFLEKMRDLGKVASFRLDKFGIETEILCGGERECGGVVPVPRIRLSTDRFLFARRLPLV